MSNPERAFESFHFQELSRAAWENLGVYWFPIPREHAEGLITRPLLSKIRDKLRRVDFDRMASSTVITFSGYGDDSREIHQIREIRSFWRKLDSELDELPALLSVQPLANYNGPVQHLTLEGEIDQIIDHPEQRGQDVHLLNGGQLIKQSLRRIIRVGEKHRLAPEHTAALVYYFLSHTEFPQPKDGTAEV